MKGSNSSRTLALLSLVIAGETIFLLPFVLARIFRPTFLDVFGISNLQLGTAFSLYGVVAMVSYFVGGPLADRFSARRLIVTAMLFTSAGGVMMSTIPALGLLTLLYGFWGLTTIFLFWGALIKTTREIGNSNQGQTYGLLDGGRGLLAAVLSSFSVTIFAALLPQDIGTSTLEQRAEALSMLILIFSGFGLLSAIIVWFFLPESNESDNLNAPHKPLINFQTIKKVGSMRTVWLQALIILCAYVAYKSTDDFSLYARDAFGYNELEAAKIATLSFWMRPIAAVAVGFLADKLNSQVALLGSFALIMVGSLVISSGMLVPGITWLLLLTMATTSAGIYGLRGLYFSILGDAKVPLSYTGAAVGLVSFIGFTPDIFMGPLMGYLLDRSPGALGHQHVFAVIFIFGLLGFVVSMLFSYVKNLDSVSATNRAGINES